MARKREPIQHHEVVRRFAARLREVRRGRGMTQADLAERSGVTVTYIGRLENEGAAPGIDLVARLASALGVELSELLPAVDPTDPDELLREQARKLLNELLPAADRATLQLAVSFLARLAEAPALGR